MHSNSEIWLALNTGVNSFSFLGERLRDCRHNAGLYTDSEYILMGLTAVMALTSIVMAYIHKTLLNKDDHYRLALMLLPDLHELERKAKDTGNTRGSDEIGLRAFDSKERAEDTLSQ